MWMGIEEYREAFFTEKSMPSINTLRRWIKSGELKGKKIGGKYFVAIEEEKKLTGNPLVDRILMSI